MANYPWDTAATLEVEGCERAFGSVETCTRSWADKLTTEEQVIAVIRTAKPAPDRFGNNTCALSSEDIEWLDDQLHPDRPGADGSLHE